jgi:iron complex transport system ATP-binding protein
MAQEAGLLLLDEPCNNLDPRHRLMVMDLIRSAVRRERTEPTPAVLMSLHDLPLAERYADRIILLHRGGIAAMGSPEAVLEDGILERVFEVTRAGYGASFFL